MPTTFQPSSFVPKGSVSSGGKDKNKGSIDFLKLISYTLFFVSILGAIGVFVFERYTLSRVSSQETQLVEVQKSLNDGLVQDIVRFESRLKEAEKLLNSHVVLSPFFEEVERRTLQSVQFTGLSVETNEEGQMVASLSGATDSYIDVALQSDAFGEGDVFLDPIVSNFDFDLLGNITFTISMRLDPDLTSYVSSLDRQL